MASQRVLLVDDEENLRSMLGAALSHNGYDVHPAADGREALAALPSVRPDVIVLDVMMPGLDGFDVCRRLRRDGMRTPVLFLSARDEVMDKVTGLGLGDDYLVKPFALDELVARLEAITRRSVDAPSATDRLQCADLELDDVAHRVRRAGAEVALTPTEYKLLRLLLANQGRVLSKPQILDHVWEYDFGGDGGIVETYIGYLRRKVDNVEPRLIRTVRGFGYTIRETT